MSRWCNGIAVLLVVLSLGFHWTVLQSVAWVTMFARYVQTEAPVAALVKALDGQNPCRLCLAVDEGRQAEAEEERARRLAGAVRLEGCLFSVEIRLNPPRVHARRTIHKISLVSLPIEPPTPPPRLG